MTGVPRRRVLVVDDEPALRLLIAAALAGDAVEVRVATSGAEALAQLRQVLPDLIVSDLDMPGLGGAAFVRACRADPRTAGVPVVLVSASSELAGTAERLGAAGWLPKPFSPRALVALVDRLTSGAAAGRPDGR